MQDIQIDIDKVLQIYANKVSELMHRIVLLEAQNEALVELVKDKDGTTIEEMGSVLKDAMNL